eukprot:22313-Eustigmatos_ZCMA.PRE.1
MAAQAMRQLRRFAIVEPPGRRVAASSAANVVSPVLTHANSSSAIWKSLCMRAHPARPPDLRPAPSLCFAARIAQKPVVSGREKA